MSSSNWTTAMDDLPISLTSVLDEIPLGVSLISEDQRVLFLNRAMEALTGFSRNQAEGIHCAYILRCNICLESCPLRSGEGIPHNFAVEGDIINQDHQKIPVRVTFAAIRHRRGNIAGFIESVEDIRVLRDLDSKGDPAYSFNQIIGRCAEMEQLFRILPAIAQSDSSVLITGQTGTGKDFVAEAIHKVSPRAKHPFIKVNCGALPETLMESELFGHQKGAFTGAVENKPGRFRLAHNGTLYLTEIGDLPLSLQVKLLTFLDDKVIYPLGSTKGFQANVRVIAATHRNLEQMVREGRFREDLLFRLNVVRLLLPPLKERGEDVRLLLDHFLHTITSLLQKPVKGFSQKSLKILLHYSYPGNVRELKNIVEYGVNVCDGDEIQPQHLPAYLTSPAARAAALDAEAGSPAPQAPLGAATDSGDRSQDWAAMERKMILEALLRAKGRRSRAAALLGWGRSTLWRKMKQFEIQNTGDKKQETEIGGRKPEGRTKESE